MQKSRNLTISQNDIDSCFRGAGFDIFDIIFILGVPIQSY